MTKAFPIKKLSWHFRFNVTNTACEYPNGKKLSFRIPPHTGRIWRLTGYSNTPIIASTSCVSINHKTSGKCTARTCCRYQVTPDVKCGDLLGRIIESVPIKTAARVRRRQGIRVCDLLRKVQVSRWRLLLHIRN